MAASPAQDHGNALVRRIKSDVNTCLREGIIPSTVASFSELHDYLDANTLGDTEAIAEDMEWVEFLDVCNAAFERVDEWLKAGRPL
jgi:hypothetical protein